MTFLDCLPPLDAIPFVIDPHVPREGVIYLPTGARGPVAFVHRGVVHIHPDLFAELERAARHPRPTPSEIARWADDGGPA